MNTFRRGNCREGMTCTDLGGDHDHVNICMGICPNPGDMCTHKVIGDYMISSYFFWGGGASWLASKMELIGYFCSFSL